MSDWKGHRGCIGDGCPMCAKFAAEPRRYAKAIAGLTGKRAVPSEGPGTEMKKLLAEKGINPSSKCRCDSRAAEMDEWGAAGCREHRAEIIQWLREEAIAQGWEFTDEGATDWLGPIVDEAIDRAEQKPATVGTILYNLAPISSERTIELSFSHGLGDAANFAHMIPLYTRRGYKVSISSRYDDQAPIFLAGGATMGREGTVHPWVQKVGKNKNHLNLSHPPMPYIGDAEDLIDEYNAVKLDFSGQVSSGDADAVNILFDRISSPVIVLHMKGETWTRGSGVNRFYPDESILRLLRVLLERTGATIIILDRDRQAPHLNAGRVCYFRDFGPGQLYEVLRRADLLIGIDSGPLHFVRFTDTPAIGIWLNHYPADFALPRANTIHAVGSNHADRDEKDGDGWNTIVAADPVPSPDFVAELAFRVLSEPANRVTVSTHREKQPSWEPWRMSGEKHPDVIFPDVISTVCARIREAQASCPYDHRPYLHPGDHDLGDKLTEEFRRGYAAIKWAVAKVIQPRAICEIGVGGGLAALAFLDACPTARYVGIDNRHHEDERGVPLNDHLAGVFRERGFDAQILIRDSKSMYALPGDFDLVHVDGNHLLDWARHDVGVALSSRAAWILVDDARDNQVCAATFQALLAARPGCTEWAMFEDTWTGSILVYTGPKARP